MSFLAGDFADIAAGLGRIVLPAALDRKFPNAAWQWIWQFVFPAGRICRDPQFGPPSRYHLHPWPDASPDGPAGSC